MKDIDIDMYDTQNENVLAICFTSVFECQRCATSHLRVCQWLQDDQLTEQSVCVCVCARARACVCLSVSLSLSLTLPPSIYCVHVSLYVKHTRAHAHAHSHTTECVSMRVYVLGSGGCICVIFSLETSL